MEYNRLMIRYEELAASAQVMSANIRYLEAQLNAVRQVIRDKEWIASTVSGDRIRALSAELAVEKMQHSVTIADEHESRTAFQDRIRSLESALQLIGNELSLHANKGPAGEAFRSLLNPTLPETACTCDSTLVTETSTHQPHCPRYVAETKSTPGFCPECLMTGGHKLRCSKAETPALKPCWCNAGCVLKLRGELPASRYCKQARSAQETK